MKISLFLTVQRFETYLQLLLRVSGIHGELSTLCVVHWLMRAVVVYNGVSVTNMVYGRAQRRVRAKRDVWSDTYAATHMRRFFPQYFANNSDVDVGPTELIIMQMRDTDYPIANYANISYRRSARAPQQEILANMLSCRRGWWEIRVGTGHCPPYDWLSDQIR